MSLERDKLKTDLAEANTRNTMLLKEGEDTTALLEKVREKEINNVEQKYQEQVRQLLQEQEAEREVLTGQSLKERQKLEREIQKLKDEETRLKERLIQTQQELEKLEREISDMAERCAELERVNNRQQR